jgi:hypothetical protein
MTDFQTQVAADMAAIMADAAGPAKTVTYTTAAGTAKNIQAIGSGITQELVSSGEGEFIVERCEYVIKTADIAAPSVLDTVTIDAAVWSIERISGIGFGKATLELVRDVPKAKQTENYRKKI